jgi:hypothetical protein
MNTLKMYEQMLKLPEGSDIEVAYCEESGKYFASHDHLVQHYKKHYPDKYIREIRAQEHEQKMAEIGEIKNKARVAAQEDEFFTKVKEDVLDKYTSNFVDLQDQLKTVKQQNNHFQSVQ